MSVCACACSQVGSLVPGPGAGRGSFAVGEYGIAIRWSTPPRYAFIARHDETNKLARANQRGEMSWIHGTKDHNTRQRVCTSSTGRVWYPHTCWVSAVPLAIGGAGLSGLTSAFDIPTPLQYSTVGGTT